MAQKKETITLGTLSVIVSEIPVSRILRLFRGGMSIMSLPIAEARKEIEALIPLALDVPVDTLLEQDLYADDFTALYEAFKRTNPAFFETARALNLGGALADVFKTVIGSFSSKLLSLSSAAMAPTSTSTDTAISSI